MKKILLIAFLVIFLPLSSRAAVLSFDTQQSTVGTNAPFDVGVDLTAKNPVNVVSLSIVFSPGLALVDVSDGNSILLYLIDKPHYDGASHTLSFSGLVPGGYSGESGRLLTVRVQASGKGPASVTIGKDSHAYLNDAAATLEALSGKALTLSIEPTQNNVANLVPDTTPPENFAPSIARLPSAKGEQWMLVFAAEDKASGIDHYEISESSTLLPWLPRQFALAESPYPLHDQQLSSLITVRAYDKQGNMRQEMLAPPNPPSLLSIVFDPLFLLGILVISLGWYWLPRRV